MDSIAADGKAPFHRGPILELQLYGGSLLDKTRAVPSKVKPLLPELRLHGLEQDRLQVAAMNRELRRAVARPLAERLLVDELAEAVEERRLGRLHRDLRDRRLQPQLAEHAHGMRQQVDPDPDGLDLRRRFVDAARNPARVQLQSERQAADPGTHNQDLAGAAPQWIGR